MRTSHSGLPAVSVVIPTFNRVGIVERAIDSLRRQLLTPLEIIVVDDGSTDATPAVLASFGESIRVIRQPNRGVSAARNAGIHAATGAWVAFLDSDDEWEPDKLARQLDAAARDPEIILHAANGAVCQGRDEREWADFFAVRGKVWNDADQKRLDDPLEWVLNAMFMTPGVMARRADLLAVGGFDQSLSMFEDLDLLARLALRGPFGVDCKPLFRVYRRGPVGQSLSERSAATPGHAARSLSRVYSKLLGCEGLPPDMRRIVRRKLSAQRADIAVAERLEQDWIASIRSFGRSIVDYPSVASGARAAAGIVAGAAGVSWVRRLRHGRQPSGLMR